MTLIHLNNMKEQDILTQPNKVVTYLSKRRNPRQKLHEKQMFVAKEEYLNQFRENGYWLIFPHLLEVHAFFSHVSCQEGVSEEVKENRHNARKKTMILLIDSIRHRTFNKLYRPNCAKLEEKYVTTMLQPDIVEIPI